MYKIGDKEFGVHFGMLFQEIYFIEVGKKAANNLFTTTTFAAFLIYYGNYNYSENENLPPAFKSLGEVYQLMEANPASESYQLLTEQYKKSQAATWLYPTKLNLLDL
jgi:hypothetical protein